MKKQYKNYSVFVLLIDFKTPCICVGIQCPIHMSIYRVFQSLWSILKTNNVKQGYSFVH